MTGWIIPPQARDTGGSKDKYNLNASCERRGVVGKTDNLQDLSKEFGGYDLIPVDDPRYIAYLQGDVNALHDLIDSIPKNAYAKREHEVQSWLGRMTLNGFRVDLDLLKCRLDEGELRKREALECLAKDWDLPMGRIEWTGRGKNKVEQWEEFASPLASLEGRQWIERVWNAFGIANPPLTETKRFSTKAEHLRAMVDEGSLHPELVEILNQVMIVTTTRTVYQTVDDCLVGDRVYPTINMGQASGRSSVTNPGLTVFGKRGERYHERDIFIPDEGHSIFVCDLCQIDMRVIAALCQDKNYMALFANGRDPHAEVAVQFFGSIEFRERVKPITHGSNYGLGQKKLIEAGHEPALVRKYFKARQEQFPVLMRWQDDIRAIVRNGELLDNGFGRKMRAEAYRAYTQAPALMGQGGAADALKTCILRLPEEFRPFVRCMVHDEVDFSAPTKDIREIMHEVKKAFTFGLANDNGRLVVVDFNTPGAVNIECDISGPGPNWGAGIK